VAQTAVLGIEIGKDVTLGKGVYFVHSLGIVIGGHAVIGDRVRFYGNNTVGTATPGYAAWKALDCRHYALTINKTLYNGGQFSQVLLPGTLELSEDGQTLTISLKQHVFNQSGTEVATGTVTGSAKRANAGNGE